MSTPSDIEREVFAIRSTKASSTSTTPAVRSGAPKMPAAIRRPMVESIEVKPPRLSIEFTTSEPVSAEKPEYMTVRISCRLTPWQSIAITAPAAMPAIKVGIVGFFIKISTTTTSTGRSSTGLSQNSAETVERISSYTSPPTLPPE